MPDPDEYIFAIDFSHEYMSAAFVSLTGNEEGAAGFDLCDFMAGESGALDKLVALLTAKARTAPGRLAGAVLSLPCDLDANRQRVLNFPQASWLDGQPLPDMLNGILGVPVVMERRAVVYLAYDRIMLGLPDDALIVGCYIDLHYETAIWHCGRPLRGKNGLAGNIAHITIQGREDICFCGKAGCVDLYGAGIRLNQMHTMIFPDTPLGEIFTRHGEHPLLLDYLTMMAYPIAVEANVLDPEFIILGGSIPGMPGFPIEYLKEQIRDLVYHPVPDRTVTFLPSPASSVSGSVAAAQYAMIELGLL